MKTRICCLLLLLGLSSIIYSKANAQVLPQNQFKNALSLDIGGFGGVYSLGYERNVFQVKKTTFIAGGGVSYLGGIINYLQVGSLHAIFKKASLEFGIGFMTVHEIGQYGDRFLSKYNQYFLSPKIGYRQYFGKENKWFFKVAFTPLYELTYWDDIQKRSNLKRFNLWGNPISLGYRF